MRRIVRVVGTAVAVALASPLIAPVGTSQAGPHDRKRSVDASIRQLEDDLEDTSAELRAAYITLRGIQDRLPGARAELAAAEQRLGQARERDRQIGQQLKVAQAEEAKAQDDLAATARSTTRTHDRVGSIARQAYQTGGIGELSVALQAESADDFAQRVVLVDTAMQLQGLALAQLAVDRAQSEAQRTRLTAVRQQIAMLKAQAEANVVRAARLEREAAAAKARVESLIREQATEVAKVESRKVAERRRLDALEAESRRLRAQLAAIAKADRERAARERAKAAQQNGSGDSGGSASADGPSGGYLSMPVSGATISSEFGNRFHPILHYWRLHAGMDFAVACGTPVRAAAGGSVVSAGWGGGYGNRVVISHGLERGVSLATTYNHLSRIVAHGGQVDRGQLIGYSGTTGSSTGCHLHFETYANGTPVNPRRWL